MTVPPSPTPPPILNADREEEVEIIHEPSIYQERRVVHSSTLEQRLLLSRVTQFLWVLFGFLEGLIGIRVVLKMIGANSGAFFTQIVYGLTDYFLWPFAGVTSNPEIGVIQFEISSAIAMIVYALIAWGLNRLIWVLFYHPETNTSTTYREERY